jgi:5'-nucleotidase
MRHLALPALALAVVATIPLSSGSSASSTPAWNPLTPVSVNMAAAAPAGHTAYGNLLAFNDFHGAIDPPTGSGAAVLGTPAGGVEYLAHWVKKLRAEGEAAGQEVVTVGAGDMIGATPLVSAAFHDEPTIELLSELGLDVSSVGNHEFDEGVTELKRMQHGGCHPVEGCFAGDGFDGAEFQYLAANVTDKRTKLPILPPVDVKIIDGVPVGFIGMTLEGTPGIVNPAGITTVDFRDEVETANLWSGLLRLLGVKAQVLLLHEGGQQGATGNVSTCDGFTGVISPIVAGLRDEIGVVVSGHTHRFYSCSLPNKSGKPVVVTSAGTNGQLVTDITLTMDRRSRTFTSIEAHNVVIENGVRNADGTWQTTAPGVFVRNPALVDPAAKVIADKYRTAVAPLANRVVGSVSADIVRDVQPSGESPLGDVIADAQLAYTASAGAQLALMNPGGIRAAITYANSPGGEAPGQVTYGEAFTVQPFGNTLVTKTMTGDMIRRILQQQWRAPSPLTGTPCNGSTAPSGGRVLQISSTFKYESDPNAATCEGKVGRMWVNGVEVQPGDTFRVTMNNFLATGGDGFTVFTEGTNPLGGAIDLDSFVAYLQSKEPAGVAVPALNRIVAKS